MEREVAIVGAGYVGLPLACAFADAGVSAVLVDVDGARVAAVRRGISYVGDVSSDELGRLVDAGLVDATTDYDAVKGCSAIVIALPTPLTPSREPDLSIVTGACDALAERLQPGQLVVLESTTYPGTTREEVLPRLERAGLTVGEDFFLAFSPERVDPGRTDWTTRTTPKIVGGITPACARRALELYGRAIDTLVPVSSTEAAEFTKLLENIFRSVNIALVNELAQLCDRMDLDVWEIVAAAATKPFGFMRFEPGPGLGGHCLPVDPFYLSWKARQYDFHTEFVELAGKINDSMPYWCLEQVARALNGRRKALNGARVHVLGVAYKSNIGDLRESPALKLLDLLLGRGAVVTYTDRFVPELPRYGLASRELDGALLEADCVCVVTAHDGVDYERVAACGAAVVDFRNATRRTAAGSARPPAGAGGPDAARELDAPLLSS